MMKNLSTPLKILSYEKAPSLPGAYTATEILFSVSWTYYHLEPIFKLPEKDLNTRYNFIACGPSHYIIEPSLISLPLLTSYPCTFQMYKK